MGLRYVSVLAPHLLAFSNRAGVVFLSLLGALFSQGCQPSIIGARAKLSPTSALSRVTAASSLGWAETTPFNTLSVNSTWSKSSSGTLAAQSIQYYSDGTCSATSGLVIDLSPAAETDAFNAPSEGAYTYQIISTNSSGETSLSDCSAAIVLDTTAPSVAGLSDDATAANTKSWTWGCSETPCTYRPIS